MSPVLYHAQLSPASRFALTTAKAVGIDLTIRNIDLLAGDHLKEDYLKINPEHLVPTLDDDGVIIGDSHAISTYLVSQYAKDDSLYPKDPKKRALVDQRLYFDASTLFARMKVITYPLFFHGKKDIEKEKITNLYESLSNLEKYVTPTGWVAGEQATLADLALAITTRSLQALGVDFSKYPKIKEWLQRCSTKFPVLDEVNKQTETETQQAIKSMLPPNTLAP